ncbi:MAG: arginine repressor [Bacillota bacterium]
MKVKRQKKIVEIITNQIISTQEELARELRKEGFNITQATVSRDIKELGLFKLSYDDHSYRYALPPDSTNLSPISRLRKVFRDSVVKIDYSENIIVIRTLVGNAHAVAACLDYLDNREILGTVAGDDTIFVVIKPKTAVEKICSILNGLLA